MSRETLITNYMKKWKEHNDYEEKVKKSMLKILINFSEASAKPIE